MKQYLINACNPPHGMAVRRIAGRVPVLKTTKEKENDNDHEPKFRSD